ncbi:ATP-grasp domain-containing protein [Aquisalimonas sp. APHAB1-3]|uniref:ATP-grasp domain-containing protein n=1 Tax=Aquisalimonas sp. APHAB1-3 TaxID=3402080 RepID=UPI003AAF58D7
MDEKQLRIAVHEDEVILPSGQRQSFSDRWLARGREAGYDMRRVDAFCDHFFDDLRGCDGFMWRFGYLPVPRLLAKRVLPAVEQGMQIPVFPDANTVWHFEDKIAQHLLLEGIGIPQPKTWVFWEQNEALGFCREATYPFVIKLAYGFRSSNVRLVRTFAEAKAWIDELFGPGLNSLAHSPATPLGRYLRRARAASRTLLGLRARGGADFSHGYLYVQEFLPDNTFDTRIAVIGERVFGFRRFNRDDDFRASGSGRIDWDQQAIDIEAVRLGFEIARRLRAQTVAIDVLKRGCEWVVGEISYTGASWVLANCPGHWRPVAANGRLWFEWVEGMVHPEDAIFDDFVAQLQEFHVPAGNRYVG